MAVAVAVGSEAGTGRISARRLWVAAESIHAVSYFAPACLQAMGDVGLKGFWAGYFAARAAPMGAVGAGPVAAAFFNFNPAMVRRKVPSCWEAADPAEVTVRRAAAASEALFDLCAPDLLAAATAALPHLRRVTARCAGEGRVLTGANRELWPAVGPGLQRRGHSAASLAVAEVWQACTTLREHRGDGHVAALLTRGLDGLAAHLLVSGTVGQPAGVLRDTRGWSDAEWEGGLATMARRGLLHPDGRATGAGHALRRSVEAMTDDLAEPPFAALGDDEMRSLYAALCGCAARIQDSGVFPFPNPIGLPALRDLPESPAFPRP